MPTDQVGNCTYAPNFAEALLELIEQKAGESVVSSLKLGPVGLALEFYSVKATAPAETAALAPIADSQPGK